MGPEALPGEVSADRDRLSQVITNLLDNAFKFTPDGGRVLLRAREHEGHIEVTVKDSGDGIAPESLIHVFDRHWRERRARSGAGLGLAICKGIVEAHRGRISAESTLGAGSVFVFRIPAQDIR